MGLQQELEDARQAYARAVASYTAEHHAWQRGYNSSNMVGAAAQRMDAALERVEALEARRQAEIDAGRAAYFRA